MTFNTKYCSNWPSNCTHHPLIQLNLIAKSKQSKNTYISVRTSLLQSDVRIWNYISTVTRVFILDAYLHFHLSKEFGDFDYICVPLYSIFKYFFY